MLLVAAAAGGIVLVFLIYMGYKLFRRYVLKIQEPGKNFVVDKKVKCRSGIGLLSSSGPGPSPISKLKKGPELTL